MEKNFIDWMNSTLNITENVGFSRTTSNFDSMDEIEKIESDASDSTTLKATIVKWINLFYADEDENHSKRPFSYFLLKSEGIEIAIDTISHCHRLQIELQQDNLLCSLFEKYLHGTTLIHQKIADIILDNSLSENTDEFERYLGAVRRLINCLKLDYHEMELMKEREIIADEIAYLNGNLNDTHVVQLHTRLKDNFESTFKISQENHEIAISKLDELDTILKELTEQAKTSMMGVEAKKKALNEYYKNKCQIEIEENNTYNDTVKSMLTQLNAMADAREKHQARLETLLVEVRELEKKIFELDELKTQIKKFISETDELMLNKNEAIIKLEEELQEELAGESIQYVINQTLEENAYSLTQILLDAKSYFDTQQAPTRNESSKTPCLAEKVLGDIMNCKFENSNTIILMEDKDEFKQALLIEMKQYKKYLRQCS